MATFYHSSAVKRAVSQCVSVISFLLDPFKTRCLCSALEALLVDKKVGEDLDPSQYSRECLFKVVQPSGGEAGNRIQRGANVLPSCPAAAVLILVSQPN